MAEKPLHHGRDHRPGGEDPIPGFATLPLWENYTPIVTVSGSPGGFLSDPVIWLAQTLEDHRGGYIGPGGMLLGHAWITLGTDIDGGATEPTAYSFNLSRLDSSWDIDNAGFEGWDLVVGYGITQQTSTGLTWPVHLRGSGIPHFIDSGGLLQPVGPDQPFAFAEGDILFNGTWVAKMHWNVD